MLKELKRQLGEVNKDLAPFKSHVAALERKREALTAAIEAAEVAAVAVAKHEKKPPKKEESKPATPAKK